MLATWGATRGVAAVAAAGDIIGVEAVSSTVLTTSPTNNINPAGWVVAVTIKDTAIGQTLDVTKGTITVSEPGYTSAGAATSTSRTLSFTHSLRNALYGTLWTTGTTYQVGDYVYRKIAGGDTTHIWRVLTKGAGTSTVAMTNLVGNSGVLADGYNWTFISDTVTGSNPPQQAIEAASGSNAVIYCVVSDFISSAATITAATFSSGFYTGSKASNPAFITLTNSSDFAQMKPHVEWTTMPWQVFGSTLHVEAYADHPYGGSGRTLACGVFTIYDNSNVSTGLTATVTSMVASTNSPGTTYGYTLPVFSADIDISSLTNGNLYSIRFQGYPTIGLVWDSDTDGFGANSGSWTISTKMTANTSKRIPFVKDASAYTTQFAVVDGVGGSPAVSTSLVTARTTPYASVSAALTGLQTANGGTLNYKTLCYIKGGTTLTGFGGDLTSRTYGTTWALVARDPGDVTTATINPDTVTAANRKSGTRIKWQDVSLITTVATPVIDNQVASTTGDFSIETWYDRCILTGKTDGTQQPISRSGLFWITNSQLTSTANMQGSTRTAWKLSMGNTILGSGSDSPLMNAVAWLGFKAQVKAIPGTSFGTSNWNENGSLLAQQIFAFGTWFNATANIAAMNIAMTVGGSWTNILIEAMSASKGGEISADACLTVPGRIYNLFNTFAGDGQNFAYNEKGTAQVQKIGIARFLAGPDRNLKMDWYDQDVAANPNRTGSLAARYAVGWYHNGIYGQAGGGFSSSSLLGELLETGSFISGTAGWTADNSKLGTNTGNGTYTPTSSSSFKSMVGATEQLFPFDLLGATRKSDGTGACGAYEYV